MQIKHLRPNQKNVTIKLKITDFGDERKFSKFGKCGRVVTALGKDPTGKICLTLWNDEIDIVKLGKTILVTNGYVNQFQGVLQLNAGRFGKIEELDEDIDLEAKEESA